MILTGNEIKLQREAGNIIISDWDETRLGPNSYNLRLSPELVAYKEAVLDPKQDNRTGRLVIPEEGLVLHPGRLYLAKTVEYTETHNLVPMLVGRSSIGRLGIFVHVTAGFGDVGFSGNWTLELTCVQPVRVYPRAAGMWWPAGSIRSGAMDRETWKIKTCPVCKTKFLSTTGKDIYCGRKCYMAQRFGMPRKKKEGTP